MGEAEAGFEFIGGDVAGGFDEEGFGAGSAGSEGLVEVGEECGLVGGFVEHGEHESEVDLADEVVTTSIDDIIRLNVCAVGVSIFVGTDYEKQTLANLSSLVNECEKYGIPVMAVTAVGKELEKRDARYLSLCCRIAAELGARVVKTYWCEDFEKVTNGCPVPVVMAGGPKCETELEVFEFVHDGMQRGAIGVNLGRNVWQNPAPVAMAKALHAVIHRGATPKEAAEIYREAKER